MTPEAAEIMEKLKDKKAEYEAIASSDSSVQLEDIDNRIIIEVLGPERCDIERSRGCSEGSRTEQKVRRTPTAASEYDEDVSAVATSAVTVYC
ncbi:hypothetical protein Gotur_001424, partial [Gossypium turneri]